MYHFNNNFWRISDVDCQLADTLPVCRCSRWHSMLINTVHKVVHPDLLQYAHACAVYSPFTLVCIHILYTYMHSLVNCVDEACCILVSIHIPTGYRIVDSLSLRTSQNFYKADTRCDILLLSVQKYQVGGFVPCYVGKKS